MKLSKKVVLAATAMSMVTATAAYASVLDRPFFKVLGVVIVWGADDYDENTGAAPVVSDFVLMSGTSGTAGDDLIADDVYAVVTGSLDPISDGTTNPGEGELISVDNATSGGTLTDDGDGVLDADDTLTAFGLSATTDVSLDTNEHASSFYVASNTDFDIYAQSSNLTRTGDFLSLDESNITFEMEVTTSGDDGLAFGSASQDPSTGGTGYVTTVDDLGDMSGADTKVFDGGQRTAASVGTIAEQSVRFDMTYTLDDGAGNGYDLSMGAGSIQADVTYTVYVP